MNSLPLELQMAVFEHIWWKQDLLSSALVCRAWRDVAWDKVLWQTQMIRLSGLLDALVGENDQREIFNGDCIPLTSDSDRFLALAARATRINLDVTLVDSLVKVLSEVARAAPGKVLFPAVHTLDCGGFDEEAQGDFAHTVFADSPIRKIWIDGGYSEVGTLDSRKLLTSLLAGHPQVQNVTALEDLLPEGVGIPEFWRLPNLRSLTYSGFIAYEEWAKFIQECPVLGEVRLVGDTRDPVPPNPPSISTSSLRRLNLEDFTSLDFTIAILESIDAPHLMAVDVDVAPDGENGEVEHPSAGRARSAFRLLAKRSQHLDSLAVNASIKLGAENLAAFSSLTRLKITDITPNGQLDDNGVELLCRSLRNLTKFHLSYWRHFDHDPRSYAKITPKSFGSFSRYCQDLTDLELPVTATKPEDFVGSILAELVAFRENLTHLELTTLTLLADRTEDFVSFLIVQCPKLSHLNIDDLKIADQQIPNSTLADMGTKMKDAYFKAQKAL